MGQKRSRWAALFVAFFFLFGMSARAVTCLTCDLGNNNFAGTPGIDEIWGLAGNDVLFGLGEQDDVDGKADDDIVLGGRGEDFVGGGTGSDVVIDDDGKARDSIVGDSLSNDGGVGKSSNIHTADGGRDNITCAAQGIDWVVKDPADFFMGPQSDCEHIADATGESFQGKYVKFGKNNKRRVQKLRGRDGMSLDPAFPGNAQGDAIYGKGGKDKIYGGLGPDDLFGGAGKDKLYGGAGQDALIDDDGTSGDKLYGGTGPDYFFAADGAHTLIDCGVDTDADHIWKDGIDTFVNCDWTGIDQIHIGAPVG